MSKIIATRASRLHVNKRHIKPQSSSAVASRVTVQQWYNNVVDLLTEICSADPRSQHALARTHALAYQTLVQAAINASIAGPAVYAAVAAPAAPAGLNLLEVAYINRRYADIEAGYVLIGAGGVAAGTTAPLYDSLIMPIPETDFNLVLALTLEAFAHSGFTTHGVHNQIIEFRVDDFPPLEEEAFSIPITDIVAAIPAGTTVRQIGAFHADTISHWLNDNNIITDWSRRHGVPERFSYLGHACWSYITDSTLLHEDTRAMMNDVMNNVAANEAAAQAIDPNAPRIVGSKQKAAAVKLAAQNDYTAISYQPHQLPNYYKPTSTGSTSYNN